MIYKHEFLVVKLAFTYLIMERFSFRRFSIHPEVFSTSLSMGLSLSFLGCSGGGLDYPIAELILASVKDPAVIDVFLLVTDIF